MPGLASLLAATFFDGQTRGDYKPFVAVFLFGMIVGIAGHITQTRDLILAGIFIGGIASVLPWIVWS